MSGQTLSAKEGFRLFMIDLQNPQPQDGPEAIEGFLNHVRGRKKGDWHIYSECKRRLDDLNITAEQYQRAHREIIDILRV